MRDFCHPVSINSESRIVLAVSERGRRETTREEIVELLGAGPKAADHAIESLRRKGWLEWAAGGSISSYAGRARAGRPPDSNLIALPRRIATRYYIGFGRAVVHYGVTTQHTDRSDLVGGVHRATVTSW